VEGMDRLNFTLISANEAETVFLLDYGVAPMQSRDIFSATSQLILRVNSFLTEGQFGKKTRKRSPARKHRPILLNMTHAKKSSGLRQECPKPYKDLLPNESNVLLNPALFDTGL
jgi:hypothetical protein